MNIIITDINFKCIINFGVGNFGIRTALYRRTTTTCQTAQVAEFYPKFKLTDRLIFDKLFKSILWNFCKCPESFALAAVLLFFVALITGHRPFTIELLLLDVNKGIWSRCGHKQFVVQITTTSLIYVCFFVVTVSYINCGVRSQAYSGMIQRPLHTLGHFLLYLFDHTLKLSPQPQRSRSLGFRNSNPSLRPLRTKSTVMPCMYTQLLGSTKILHPSHSKH